MENFKGVLMGSAWGLLVLIFITLIQILHELQQLTP